VRPFKSLSLKITTSILTAVLLIFAAIFIYNYRLSRDLLLENVKENVKNLGVGNALKIEKLLESSSKIPETMAHILGDLNYDLEELEEFLEVIVGGNKEIFGSCMAFEPYVFNKDSLYYAPYAYRGEHAMNFKFLEHQGNDYFEQEWYSVPARSGKAHWSEPYYDEGGGEILMCTYSVPVYSTRDQEKFIGVVTIDLSLKWLEEFIESIEAYESGYAFLISRQGLIITDPLQEGNELESIFIVAKEREYDVLHLAGKDMVSGGSDFIEYESPLIEGKSWLFYTPIPSAGWSLSLIIPEKEFMTDLHTLNRDLLLIGVGGIILIMLLVIFISARITRPLSGLARIAIEIGKGKFETPLPATKSKDEIGQLSDAISRMQKELKEYIINLRETTAAKEKIESELQIARDIQQGIIPKIFPPFPDRENLDLYAVLEPARDVGGDLYDFFFVDDDHLCFAIGDVSGKGVPASLFMAITRTLLRANTDKHSTVNEVITAMNNELCLENDNAMFVTLFLGILNVKTGELSFCNAGHNYPFIRNTDGKVSELKMTHGTPLGAMPDIDFESTEMQFSSGDHMIMYTDGVSEAIDVDENQYTEQRIMRKLSGMEKASPERITRAIIDDLNIFVGKADQFDDITMLVISWQKDTAGSDE